VLSHCYYGGGIYNNDEDYLKNNINPYDPYANAYYNQPTYIEQRKIGKWLTGTNTANNNRNTCSYFLEPHSYESLFKNFCQGPNPLKFCLAHFGGSEMMRLQNQRKSPTADEAALYGVLKVNWYQQVKNLMNAYPGVYADIAYTLADSGVHDIILSDLNDIGIGQRIMYGTDYFLAERDMPEKLIYENFKKSTNGVQLTNYNQTLAWDQIAQNNIYTFLASKYNPMSDIAN